MFRESCFSLISWSQRTPHSLNEKPPYLDCAINVRAPQHCIITAIILPLKTHNLPGDKNDQFIWVNNTSLLKMWIAPKLKRLGNKWLEDLHTKKNQLIQIIIAITLMLTVLKWIKMSLKRNYLSWYHVYPSYLNSIGALTPFIILSSNLRKLHFEVFPTTEERLLSWYVSNANEYNCLSFCITLNQVRKINSPSPH